MLQLITLLLSKNHINNNSNQISKINFQVMTTAGSSGIVAIGAMGGKGGIVPILAGVGGFTEVDVDVDDVDVDDKPAPPPKSMAGTTFTRHI